MRRSALVGIVIAVFTVSLYGQDARQPPALVAAQPAATVTGVLDSVIVYRGQARVSRLIDVPAGAEPREMVISGLPERVAPGSLNAEPLDGVAVRSVTFRIRPVSDDVREEVRKFDAQIVEAQDVINAVTRQGQLLAERKSYLDQLQQFSAATSTTELKSGVLNAETLKNLTLFMFDERQKIAAEELKNATDRRTAQEKLNLLQRQRAEVAGGPARSAREAVVFLQPAAGAAGRIRLNYLVDGASWSPSYNIRAGADRKAVTVEYNAAVQQMSGEDWTNVSMTLSTATPSLIASAPKLDPLAIDLVAVSPERAAVDYLQRKQELLDRRRDAELYRNNSFASNGIVSNFGFGGGGANGPVAATSPMAAAQAQTEMSLANADADSQLNEVAGEMQKLEIVADKGVKDGPASRLAKVATDEQSVSVTYALPGRTSLPSRSDQQLIQIASSQMNSSFYKLAAPVLTSNIYDQATLVNTGKLVLLAGPVSSYLDGQFVGAGQIPTIAIGETFNVGFGIDSSLRASRELLDKTDSTQGGNKVLEFTYRLTVDNFGAEPASVRLIDRIPTSKDPNVKITQTNSTVPVSKADTYTEAEKKAGMLRWDVEVAAGANGAKAMAVEHKYRIEHDRQMTIGGMAAR